MNLVDFFVIFVFPLYMIKHLKTLQLALGWLQKWVAFFRSGEIKPHNANHKSISWFWRGLFQRSSAKWIVLLDYVLHGFVRGVWQIWFNITFLKKMVHHKISYYENLRKDIEIARIFLLVGFGASIKVSNVRRWF